MTRKKTAAELNREIEEAIAANDADSKIMTWYSKPDALEAVMLLGCLLTRSCRSPIASGEQTTIGSWTKAASSSREHASNGCCRSKNPCRTPSG